MSKGGASFSPRIKPRAWPLIIPALSLAPAAGYVGVLCARWSAADLGPGVMIGALLFAVLFLPMVRILLRLRLPGRKPVKQEASPKRVLVSALPLAGLVFALPTLRLVSNVFTATTGEPPPAGVMLPLLLLAAGIVALAYTWPLFTAARAVASGAISALDASLVASSASLLVMAVFVRLTSEAQHFHGASLLLGIAFSGAATVGAAASLVVSIRRRRWVREVFQGTRVGWSVVRYQPSIHGPVAPLDASTPAVSDGVLVRSLPKSDASAPYRSNDGIAPIARTWLDEGLALRPLARRVQAAALLIASTAVSVPLLASSLPDVAHLVREDTRATTPSRPLGFPADCAGHGPIYFVPVGEQDHLDVQALAERYSAAYHRRFEVLPRHALPAEAYDDKRMQWGALSIFSDLKGTIATKGKTVIALTSNDIYAEDAAWRFAYAVRADPEMPDSIPPGLVIVSNARMRGGVTGRDDADAILDYRFRKMLTKQLGIVYCGYGDRLPTSNRRSVLHTPVGLPELDDMDESVW